MEIRRVFVRYDSCPPVRLRRPRSSGEELEQRLQREDEPTAHQSLNDGGEIPQTLQTSGDGYVSQKRSKGKEIDARWVDETEWDVFRNADTDNWQAHVTNGAVKVLSPSEVNSVIPHEILRIPSRFVSVNKDKNGQSLNAKLRWVVPGHVVPRDGTRCDAPISPRLRCIVF
eukprot:853894-Amphidinium_carterae.4